MSADTAFGIAVAALVALRYANVGRVPSVGVIADIGLAVVLAVYAASSALSREPLERRSHKKSSVGSFERSGAWYRCG